jgi:hypothetical protein
LASVGVFTRLNDPNVSLLSILSELHLVISGFTIVHEVFRLLLFLNFILFLHVVRAEARKLGVIKTIFDVESHGNSIEHIFTHSFVVEPDIQKHGLFVAEMEIVFKFVI